MDYFERSQQVKEEIRTDSGLLRLIADHVNGTNFLDELGRGTMNVVYRVGKTDSGLWIGLRENTVRGMEPQSYISAACVYESYCLDAEKQRDSPSFCIGGTSNEKPFLLVEDVTQGGDYTPVDMGPGSRKVLLVRGDERKIRFVDLGDDDYLGVARSINFDPDVDIEMQIIMNTFDLGLLKYFSPQARLDI